MDLQTENRIAAILLKEAAELRRQAEEEGVLGYLRQPKPRGRPNSRFLTATVRGVQQANRTVEENEMWRSRQKELELEGRIRGRFKEESSSSRYREDRIDSERNRSKRHADSRSGSSYSCSLEKIVSDNSYLREDEGLRDDEVEEFLRSRIKRGRGDVGSRMDETGPYLPSFTDSTEKHPPTTNTDRWSSQGHRLFLGPEKPILSRVSNSSDDDSPKDKKRKDKKIGSSKKHSEKHKSKRKLKDKKKRKSRDEKKHKHHKS